MSEIIQNRYEFVYLFDVKDGNPNGDPDAGNTPRVDPETGHGLISDVCLKRKVRNYVAIVKGEKPPFDIYIKEKAVLNDIHEKAYEAIGENPKEKSKEGKEARRTGEVVEKAREWLCKNFYDIRTFGAVMATEVNAGIVKGPIQLTFARSVVPVISLEHSITRLAVTNKRDRESERTMGRKHTIPYGLYRCHGFVSAHYAEKSGFTESDLELFWEALRNMFDHDRSAARGEMNFRKLVIFKHVSKDPHQAKLGTNPAHVLLESVKVKCLRQDHEPIRSYEDFHVTVPQSSDFKGIEVIEY
ncbi:MAG: type I-C CRISPR-associated protein Cas7/Csd2 [Leptospiraceae bacterium]|nr:type I-C CRISPR-associated protein Cas7/Csd2 [Leptospiraceae bacterium]MDW8305814.1 type I-C CRISPR-associated protein Cas7/Csd2 [Leptospiraceae bacterium]